MLMLTMVHEHQINYTNPDMNVCNKVCGNPSNSWWDFSLKTTNVNLHEEKSEDKQSYKDSSSKGPWMSVQNVTIQ